MTCEASRSGRLPGRPAGRDARRRRVTLLHPAITTTTDTALQAALGPRTIEPVDGLITDLKPMLTHIQIRDFAIIDAVELELGSGLTVLTGETGAGKSILVDALLLAAGGRAGAEVVRQGRARRDLRHVT